MAYLHVVYTNGHEMKYQIAKTLVRIGRHSVNDLQLADDSASRLHAEICRKPGQYVVRDLKSKNGIQVNNEVVKEHVLADGDEIAVGTVVLRFHYDDDESFEETAGVEAGEEVEEKKKSGPIVQAKRSAAESKILQVDWSPAATADPEQLQNRLKSITSLCRLLMTARSVDDLIGEAMDEIIRHVPYDCGCVMLGKGEPGDLKQQCVRDHRGEGKTEGRISVSLTIAESCLRERTGVLCTDAGRDSRFSPSESIHALQLHSVLCAPFLGHDGPLGIVYLESRADRYVYNESDLDYLVGVASELSIGLEHMQLREDRAREDRMGLINQTISSLSGHVQTLFFRAEDANRMFDEAVASGKLENVKSVWQGVRKNNEDIARLLSDMIEYTQPHVGEVILGNVNTVIENVIQELVEPAEQCGVKPIVQLDEQLSDGYFNAEGLHRLILNLALNAIDAVQNAEETEVVILTDQADGNAINIVIQDSGSGLSPDEKKQVFEPFFSPSGTEGTGLKLSIVQKLVGEIGAKIECESEPGLGTTFIVTLPVPKEAPAPETDPRTDPSVPDTYFDEDLEGVD